MSRTINSFVLTVCFGAIIHGIHQNINVMKLAFDADIQWTIYTPYPTGNDLSMFAKIMLRMDMHRNMICHHGSSYVYYYTSTHSFSQPSCKLNEIDWDDDPISKSSVVVKFCDGILYVVYTNALNHTQYTWGYSIRTRTKPARQFHYFSPSRFPSILNDTFYYSNKLKQCCISCNKNLPRRWPWMNM